jgi:hypothetical protein
MPYEERTVQSYGIVIDEIHYFVSLREDSVSHLGGYVKRLFSPPRRLPDNSMATSAQVAV